jgi:4-hydroxy-tetrahydrodipicolinate reductase
MATRIGIIGFKGRMGQTIARLIPEFAEAQNAGGIDHAAAPDDAKKLFANADVAIDFTTASATAGYVKLAAEAGVPFLSGTTGLDDAAKAVLREAATQIPVLYATNTSLSLAVMKEITRYAARLLKDYDYDVSILDRHHRMKKDAPSGTAKTLGECVNAGNEARHVPTFAAIRGGGIVGEHEVSFNGFGEVIRLCHSVTSRDVFARGAIQGALWLARQKAGLYTMDDVLGIRAGA